MRFGFVTQASKFFLMLYFQIQELICIIFPAHKTGLSYMSLAIDTARQKSTDLAIAVDIQQREVLIKRTISYLLQV